MESVCTGQRAGSTCRQHLQAVCAASTWEKCICWKGACGGWLQEWGWPGGRLGGHGCGRIGAGAPPSPPPLILLLLPQVEKAVKLRRAKLVLLAPNIASLEGGEGGEAAALPSQPGASACPASALAALAAEREVPLVFALSRQRMGKVSWAGRAGHQPRDPAGQGPPQPHALCSTFEAPVCRASSPSRCRSSWANAREPAPLRCWTQTACLRRCGAWSSSRRRGGGSGARTAQRLAAAAGRGKNTADHPVEQAAAWHNSGAGNR